MDMTISRILGFGLIALANGALIDHALAQQDVQVTSEAISRACADIHHTPNATAEAPTIRGEQDITLNCRLVGAGGATIAQVSPGEVCQRLTGSTEWYRGMGTQVFCRVAGATTTAAPAPRSFTITEDDIAKACQRTHRNPQATAEPTTTGPYGLELNCRLVNQNGVTLARVSPEDVCESKFGTREWMSVLGGNTFVCKATPIAKLPPDQFPNKPPGGGGSGGSGSGGPAAEAFDDVPLSQEAMTRGCRILHGAEATAAPVTNARNAGHTGGLAPIINCNSPGGLVSHSPAEFCPKVSGTSDWYLTDFGRGTWLPGETPGAAPRIHVCRGTGPLQYHALADIGRYCTSRGYRYANYGVMAQKPPVCFNQGAAPVIISIADVCREVHRAGSHELRGVVYFCLPANAPVATAAPTATRPIGARRLPN